MRRTYGMGLLAGWIVALTVLGNAASAQTYYWERTLSKGRTRASAASSGQGRNAMNVLTPFNSTTPEDTGLVSDTAGPIIQTKTAANNDGLGTAFANGTVIAQLAFNPAGQLTTTGTLGSNVSASIHGGPSGESGIMGYGVQFVLEAIHILRCTGCAPSPPAKTCTLKLHCDWNWSAGLPHTVVCDWAILGYPGSPLFISDATSVIVSYTDSSLGFPIPVQLRSPTFSNPTGGIYVDIPGNVPINTSITWVSRQGTGQDTAGASGTFGTNANSTVAGGSLIGWLLWMQIN